MKTEPLTDNIRVRVSKSWKEHLTRLAMERGPGTKLSDLAREAIYRVYFAQEHPAKKNGNGKKK
jgi:hypothetical protein